MDKIIEGDCLNVLPTLTEEHGKGFVDLVYIDPPFNTDKIWINKRTDHQFKDKFRVQEDSILPDSIRSYIDYLSSRGKRDAAYASAMAVRIGLIYDTLKEGGSFYIQCDHHSDFILREICNIYFGELNLRNVIVWCKRSMFANAPKFVPFHEVILYYTKGKPNVFNPETTPMTSESMERYNKRDEGGKYLLHRLIFPNNTPTLPDSCDISYMGYQPTDKEVWRMPRRLLMKLYPDIDYTTLSLTEKLDLLKKANRLGIMGSKLQYKIYLSDNEGVQVGDVWNDISPIRGSEVLDYPTQKPVKLLGRIIQASTNEGDLVMDCFCGSGSTLEASKLLKRKYIGIDKNPEAIKLATGRLKNIGTMLL